MISVIIPTYNRAPFLKKAIESVILQSYQDFEIIIIDDGSTDNTPEVISKFGDRVIYVRKENEGPSAARNKGVKVSRGGFVAFLDSDDRWHREKLAIQVREMEKNPNFLISHTQELWYKNGNLLPQKERHSKYGGYIFDKCLPLCSVSMSTAMVRKGIFDSVGGFDESLPCCEDYDFWLRVSTAHPFLLVNKPLTLKDGGRSDQVSYIYRVGMDKFRIQAILKMLESGGLNYEERRLAIQELKKKCLIYGRGCIKYGKIEEARFYLELPKALKKGINK